MEKRCYKERYHREHNIFNLRDTDVVMWIILILLNEADTHYIYKNYIH